MEMQYRRVGRSGLNVSAIALGAWLTYGGSVEDETATKTIHTAIENGINFIDVANAYAAGRAEEVVGRAIKDFQRSDLVISTKAYYPMSDNINDRGLSRKHIFESVEKSLKRFDIDYIDIFFCHRYDSNSPTEETVRALEDMIRQGKLLYWGTSMWNPSEISDAVGIAKQVNAFAPVVEQPLYNMLDRSALEGHADLAGRDHGIGFVVFSPLAQGILTGKYNDGIPAGSRVETVDWFNVNEKALEKARAVSTIAQDLGVSSTALALAWALHHQHVDSVIMGASNPGQVEDNLKALEVEITEEVEARIEDALANKPKNSQR